MCGKFQVPLRLLLIWARIFRYPLDIHIEGCFFRYGSLPIGPNGPLCKFFNNIFKKIQIDRGSFLSKKNCLLMYLGLHIEVRLKKLGVCQLPKNGLIWEFFKYFLYKIKIERGVHLKKNFANSRI